MKFKSSFKSVPSQRFVLRERFNLHNPQNDFKFRPARRCSGAVLFSNRIVAFDGMWSFGGRLSWLFSEDQLRLQR